MAAVTQIKDNCDFIISEATGHRSRANGVLSSGQVVKSGQLLMASGVELIAHDGLVDSNGVVTTAVAGISLYHVDATDGDKPISYIIGEAEVNGYQLVYADLPDTSGAREAGANTSLAARQIYVR